MAAWPLSDSRPIVTIISCVPGSRTRRETVFGQAGLDEMEAGLMRQKG